MFQNTGKANGTAPESDDRHAPGAPNWPPSANVTVRCASVCKASASVRCASGVAASE